jgi:hypothetical protein
MQVVDANGNVFGAGLEINGPDGKPKTTGGGGGVTTVTATAPVLSTGGTTPDISIPQADSSQSGFLDSSDWNHFNNKQDGLISGSNIKTVNGGSIVGSGNLSVGTVTSVTASFPMQSTAGTTPVISMPEANSSGSSGWVSGDSYLFFARKLGGMQAFSPGAYIGSSSNGQGITAQITGLATSAVSTSANIVRCIPFIPSQLFYTLSFSINVTTAAAGANARILIYDGDNTERKPYTKLYESEDLNCSTTGIKTTLVYFEFIEGVVYYLCTHTSATLSFTHHAIGSLINIGVASGFTQGVNYQVSAPFGSAPDPIIAPTLSATTVPVILITPWA